MSRWARVFGWAMLAVVPALGAQRGQGNGAQGGGPGYDRPAEIHIDQHCHIVTVDPSAPPDEGHNTQGGLRFRADPGVCSIESRYVSQHWVDGPGGGRQVTVREQEYLLSDPLDVPVTFVVAQHLAGGWTVDSDPRPVAMEGHTAIFRVQAVPGQTVRLHVGIER